MSSTPAPATRFWSAVALVAQREITAQARRKGSWLTFAALVVTLFAGAIVPGLLGDDSRPTVATVGPQAARAVAAGDLQARPVADRGQAEALVRSGEVDAAVVADPGGGSATGVRVVAMTQMPFDVVAALAEAPPVDLLAPDGVDDTAVFLAAFAFAVVFFVFAMLGITIAQSVVTEKQTRIVEILVATVPVRAMLTGKIAAHSLLVFAQAAVLAGLAPIALRAGDQGVLLALIGPALGWYVPFFLLGFVLLASMWAVAGALISRMEELSSTSSLVMMLAMLPYLGVTFFQDNERAMTILSYVPFSAAVAMPVRMFAADPRPWEPWLSMGILAATLVGSVLVATRLYTGSLLQNGGRVALRHAWSRAETSVG